MTVFYAVIQFLFWFAFGTATAFSSVYLLACGISNTVIGLIASAACGVSMIVQPALAAYADRERAVSVKSILLGMCSVLACIGALLLLTYGRGRTANALLFGCAILAVQAALPMVNALATEMMNAGKAVNFSAARGVGSIGYAVMSLTVGKLAAALGERTIPAVLLSCTLALGAAIAFFPFRRQVPRSSPAPGQHGDAPLPPPASHIGEKAAREKSGQKKPEQEKTDQAKVSLKAFLKKYPSFPAVLAGCVFIYTGHVFINNFLYQIVSFKGGTSEHMGVVMAAAGLLEVLTMFLFPRLQKWKGSSFWFRICGVFFTLKCLFTLLAGSMGSLYAVQLLQPFGWGLMTVSSVYYVNELMEPRDKIKGQAFMTMTLSAGSIIGSLLGGWLIDTAGVPGMLAVSVVCSLIGTAIVIRKASEKASRAE